MERAVKQLLGVMLVKVFRVAYSREIYPTLFKCICKAERDISHQVAEEKVTIHDSLGDNLYQHFVKEVETRSSRKGRYFIKEPGFSQEKVELKNLIENRDEFYNNTDWQIIFYRANTLIKKSARYMLEYKAEIATRTRLDSILYQRPSVSIDNLLNTDFLYSRSNIYDTVLNNCPISIGGFITSLHEENEQNHFL